MSGGARRSLTRARSTRTDVEVEDRFHPAAESQADDGDPLRWGTICWGDPATDRYHGGYCSHPTLALARAFAAAPEEWCCVCQDERA